MASEKEKYVVSARKYRPQTFNTVVGQEHITTTLKNAIRSGHLAHAYLFCGPRGVGKTTCARILARTLNCETPTEDMEACGKCATCQSFKNNNALNIFELDAASNNSVDDIRRLTEQVRYAPQQGKYNIYIIDEVHMLSSSAFNAFLKTLEEPPSYAIFILATTEKHKILPTILSRCQIFDFKRIQPKAIVEHLQEIADKESLTAEETALHIIAQKSEGCMRDALSMMDRLAGFGNGQLTYEQVVEHLNILDTTAYLHFSEMIWSKDVAGTLLFLDELLQKGFEGDRILNGFSEYFRNLLLCRNKRLTKLLELPEAHKKQLFEHAQLTTEAYIVSALSLLNETELSFKNALDRRLHVELCLIRLCYLNDLVSPGDVLSDKAVSEIKKKPEVNPNPAVKSPKNTPSNIGQKSKTFGQEPSIQRQKIPSKSAETATGQNPTSVATDDISEVQEPKVDVTLTPQKKSKTVAHRPKMSANLLKEIQEQNNLSQEESGVEISQELVEKIWTELKSEWYKDDIALSAQLKLMNIRLEKAEEIQLICNSEINLSYAKNCASKIREYIQNKLHLKALKVIAVLDPNAKPIAPSEKIKSKQEIFEEFTEKSPELKKLKQSLNLTVAYGV